MRRAALIGTVVLATILTGLAGGSTEAGPDPTTPEDEQPTTGTADELEGLTFLSVEQYRERVGRTTADERIARYRAAVTPRRPQRDGDDPRTTAP